MNILRLVAAEKEKKKVSISPEFRKLEETAAEKDQGQCPIALEKAELRKSLTPVQYYVTQEKGTERPFSGKLWRQKGTGIYTCIICDSQLFLSDQKFDSMCGWPAFSDVIARGKVTLKKDMTNCSERIEVVCSQCGAHLGHVFDDGPRPSRLRYCINSASLDFKKHTSV